MEVSLQVAKAPKEGEKVKDEDVLLECTFTMVSLDPQTKKPVNVNPLIVETPEEKRLFALGEKNSRHRKEQSKTSLIKHTPDDLESDLIHNIWKKELQFIGESLLTVETSVLAPLTCSRPQRLCQQTRQCLPNGYHSFTNSKHNAASVSQQASLHDIRRFSSQAKFRTCILLCSIVHSRPTYLRLPRSKQLSQPCACGQHTVHDGYRGIHRSAH